MKLVILVKAKYLSKWKDKSGKTRYRYKPLKGPSVGYTEVSASHFAEVRDKMLSDKYSGFVTKYTPEEYKKKGARMYVSPSGTSGYAITRDGDLISVFSKPGSGAGVEIMKTAIKNGAKTLDCIGPYLPQFYAKFGFEEVDRLKWDDQYAPPNWDYERLGRPDIVMMKLRTPKVLKSKPEMNSTNEPDFKKLSLEYARDFFGDEFVNAVLRENKNNGKE